QGCTRPLHVRVLRREAWSTEGMPPHAGSLDAGCRLHLHRHTLRQDQEVRLGARSHQLTAVSPGSCYSTWLGIGRPSSAAMTFSAASRLIAVRASTVAEAVCGSSTTFSSSAKPGASSGSCS